MRPAERLYAVLPAILRRRDAEVGEPLRALLAVLESELATIEANADTAWDNWFIETCEDWVVPYIAAALGVRGLRDIHAPGFSARAFVAHTIAYRRRKGTSAVAEQLARDATGHAARVIEYFARVLVSMHLQHIREPGIFPANLGTFDVRRPRAAQILGTPFGREAHQADVRRISSGMGRYNLPNLGLHLWRVRSRDLRRSEARPIDGETLWYRVNPHGADLPLYSQEQREGDITSIAELEHIPHPLTRWEVADEESGRSPPRSWNDQLQVAVMRGDGSERLFTPTGANRLRVAALTESGGALRTTGPENAQTAWLDPESGRILFHPDTLTPAPVVVLVDYAYGYLSESGAGGHDRTLPWAEQLGDDSIDLQIGVSKTATAVGAETIVDNLTAAVEEWNARVSLSPNPATMTGLIVLMDNRRYDAPEAEGDVPLAVRLPPGARLHIVAAGWTPLEEEGGPVRNQGNLSPVDVRPVVLGDLLVVGEGGQTAGIRSGGLHLNGLAIEGNVRVASGSLEHLSVSHCTLLPPGGVLIEDGEDGSNPALAIRVSRSVLGPIVAAGRISSAAISDSAVRGAATGIALPGARLELRGTTVFGEARASSISGTEVLFTASVNAENHQDGCLRYSFVPPGGRTPRRYRCQPDLALEGIREAAARARVLAKVRPSFVSEEPLHPSFAVLTTSTPAELARGGENGREIGFFSHLELPLREANLRVALRTFLRHGLEAGVLYES